MTTQQDENELIKLRRQRLQEQRDAGTAYRNDFKRRDLSADILEQYASLDDNAKLESIEVAVAGRLMQKRVMGKAGFGHIQDQAGRIQFYAQRDGLAEGEYNAHFKRADIGDIIGIQGYLFRTQTGELTIHATKIVPLVKGLRPLPEKYHGLADTETKYRQRYLDLMMDEQARERFRTRAKVISAMRRFLDERGYLEIESPIMQPIPGGATAKPFITHHNALDIDLYLRVAQELYIKRCLVGGFDKVYELNRNFRNEGLSTRHNPEFTMLEYNEAYVDYEDYMDLTEELIRTSALAAGGTTQINYQGMEIDLAAPFERLTVRDAILRYNEHLSASDLDDVSLLTAALQKHKIKVEKSWGHGRILMELFEATVEEELVLPTFITQYPVEVSPLSRRNDKNPQVVDRFELFIARRELANGFSELNDADDQAARFKEQVAAKDAGDDEAMYFDADYIRALEYGLPPNAGGGIGVDRLVMLLTDRASIRDVILFPHMKPEA